MQEGPEGVKRLPEKLQGMAVVRCCHTSMHTSFLSFLFCFLDVNLYPQERDTLARSPRITLDWKKMKHKKYTTGGPRRRRRRLDGRPAAVGGERGRSEGKGAGAGQGLWVRFAFVFAFVCV